jgi:hypothetical protein
MELFSEMRLRILRCAWFACVVSVLCLVHNICKGIQNIYIFINFNLLIILYFCGKKCFGNKTSMYNIALTGSTYDGLLCECLPGTS